MGITLSDKQRSIVRQRIEAAKSWKEELLKLYDDDEGRFKDTVERNLHLLFGRYWHKLNRKQMKSVNHILVALLVKHMIVTGGETQFIVKARQERFLEAQDKVAELLNYLWHTLGYDWQTDQARWDVYAHGLGVVELGWRYEVDEEPVPIAMPEPMIAEGMEGVQLLDQFPGQTLMAEPAPMPEPIKDEPFIERFSPRDFFVDPSCTSYKLTNARYVYRRKLEPLETVKANPLYSNTKDLKGRHYAYFAVKERDSRGLPEPPPESKDDLLMVELEDCYMWLSTERKKKPKLLHVVFASETDKELLCEDYPYQDRNRIIFDSENPFPFELTQAVIADADTFQPLADVTRARDKQVTFDESFTLIEWQRAHSPNVLLLPEGLFEGEEGQKTKQRLESGKENIILSVNPAFLPNIKWLDRPPIHVDAYKDLETVRQEIFQILGVSEYQSNMLPDKEMTKAEVLQLGSQGGTRQESEAEAYHDFLSRIAYKLLTLVQFFMPEQMQYSTMDEIGGLQFGNVNLSEMRGTDQVGNLERPGIQFMVEIDPSKKVPTNEYMERQEATELLTTLGPAAQMPDPRLPSRPLVNLPVLLKSYLAKYNMPNADQIIPPDPTPEEIEQFQQQQEEQARQAEEQARKEQERDMRQGETKHMQELERDSFKSLLSGRQTSRDGGNAREY